MTTDPPAWKTVRFWTNVLLFIVSVLQEAGVIPGSGSSVAIAATASNLGISAGKRSPTIAPLLGY